MNKAETPSATAILECPLLWHMWIKKMDAEDEKRRRERIKRDAEYLHKLLIIGTLSEAL